MFNQFKQRNYIIIYMLLNLQKLPKCINKNKALEVCNKKNCNIKNPFICGQCKNNQCYFRHRDCKKLIRYQDFTDKIQSTKPQMLLQFKKYIEKIDSIYQKIIYRFEKEQKTFELWANQVGFSNEVIGYYEIINNDKFNDLTGNDVFQLGRKLNFEKQFIIKDKEIIQKQINNVNNTTSNLIELLKKLYLQNYQISQKSKNAFITESLLQISSINSQISVKTQHLPNLIDKFVEQNKPFLFTINNYITNNQLNLGNRLPTQKHIILIQHIKTPYITKLLLNDNKLIGIQPLTSPNFHNLKFLSLQYNSIKNISALKRVKFFRIQSINLSYNQIENIDVLPECDFSELSVLHLNYNQIVSIEPLTKVKFKKMKLLNLYDNNIISLSPLLNVNFPNLQILTIYNNKLNQIELKQVKLKVLERFAGVNIRVY